jgi:hypothetical protein
MLTCERLTLCSNGPHSDRVHYIRGGAECKLVGFGPVRVAIGESGDQGPEGVHLRPPATGAAAPPR